MKLKRGINKKWFSFSFIVSFVLRGGDYLKKFYNVLRKKCRDESFALFHFFRFLKNSPSFFFRLFKNFPQFLFRFCLEIKNLKFKNYFLIVKYLFCHPRKFYNALSKQSQKWTKRLAVVSLIVLLSIPASFWYGSKTVEAAWWNDSWLYRKSIAVTNASGGELTGFQVKVLSNVDLSADITAGKIQSNLNDLRFTDVSGNLLPYWIEDTTTSSVDVWVKMLSIPPAGATVYFYYGNVSAPSYSDGNKVFEFFDDFNGPIVDTNKWTVHVGSPSIANSFIHFNGASANDGITSKAISALGTGSYGVEIRHRINSGSNTWNFGFSGSFSGNEPYGVASNFQVCTTCGNASWTFRNSATTFSTTTKDTEGLWRISKISYIQSTSGTATTYTDGRTSSLITATTTTSLPTMSTFDRIHLISFTKDVDVDWVFIRKNASTDPSVATPATEEKGTGPVAYWAFDEGQGTVARDSVVSKGFITNATGGTITTVNGYRIHTFTANGTFTPTTAGNVEVLVVAGGGGGGNNQGGGGGGGGGGLIYNTAYSITQNTAYSVVVGAGGAGLAVGVNATGNSGANSQFGTLIAQGGGAGGGTTANSAVNGVTGGSGGGNCYYGTGAIGAPGVSGQGFSGGASSSVNGSGFETGGGGGGAGGAGSYGTNTGVSSTSKGGNGGVGISSNISGTNTYYAGGGGGGNNVNAGTTAGIGGNGGGGNGGIRATTNATSGTANTGGGGGGGGSDLSTSGSGGSGVVIIRYPINTNDGALTNMASPASSTSGWQSEDQCISGKCLAFDGTDDYVDTPSSFTYGTGDFTWSLWVNPSSFSGNNYIIDHNSNGGVLQYLTGVLRYYNSASGYINAGSLSTNIWSHIVVVRRSGTTYVYVNGILISSGADSYNYPTSKIRIGSYGGGGYTWNGKIDEPKIYDYARSAAQIRMDYNAGIAGTGGVEGASVSLGSKSADWITNGLVGYWKMNETSWNGTAGEVKDASGNSNNGTAVNGVTTGAGKFGNGGSFDGTNDYINTGKNFRQTDGTINLWFKGSSNASGGAQYLLGQQSSTPTMAVYQDTNNKLSFWIRNNAGTTSVAIQSNTVINDSMWHLFTGTWGASGMKMYIDGSLNSSNASTVSDDGSTANMVIGGINVSGTPNYFWQGSIDETRIYNRALSPKEVKDLYSYAPGPVAYYNMEDGSGTTTDDISGNGNTGVLVNGPIYTAGKFGKALSLDGVDDYVNLTNNPWSNLSSSGSVDAWFYIPQTVTFPAGGNGYTFRYVFGSLGFSGGGGKLGFRINSNGSDWWTAGNGVNAWANPAGTWNFGQWYHVAIVWNSTSASMYRNGILLSTNSFSPNSTTNGQDGLGINWDGNKFFGLIDEVKIYNYARTSDQIMEDMNARGTSASGQAATVSASGKTALAYYKFDEGYGTIAHDSVTSKGFVANATGGTITESGGYRIHTFTSDGTFTPSSNGNVEVLVVAGGGGGGSYASGGGGGGGGVLYNGLYPVSSGAIAVTVGAGGAGGLWGGSNALNGGNSTFGSLVAVGGGRGGGGWINQTGATGGSGGGGGGYDGAGGAFTIAGGSGTADQGYNGGLGRAISTNCGAAGGGGGAGAVGGDSTATPNTGGNGGAGKSFTLSGSSVYYGGGGGGATYCGAQGTGGLGGGGNAGNPPTVGTTNTGGGGGGSQSASSPAWNGANGGSGIVIVRYPVSNNDNSGVLTNMASPASSTSGWTSQGKFGKALTFDGVNDYVVLPTTGGSDTKGNLGFADTDNFTLSLWYKGTDTGTGDGTMGKTLIGRDSSDIYANLILFDGYVEYLHYNGSWLHNVRSMSRITDNQWHHVVFINHSNETGDLYVDGAQQVSGLSTSIDQVTRYFKADNLMRGQSGFYTSGQIDEVKIYPFALTTDEVALDYNQGSTTVMGSKGTDASGNPSNSSDRAYCVPGDASACSAPVGEWNFEEGSGITANDTAGSNTGTLTNGPTYTAGKIGKALNFDGVNDSVVLNSTITLGNGNWTVSAWVNTTTGGSILSNNSGGPVTNNLEVGSNRIGYRSYNSGWNFNYGTSTITDGRWHYLTWVNYNNNTMSLFVDGKVENSGFSSTTNNGGPVNSIGRDWAASFNGRIDQVRYYDYARTPAQIAYEYNRGAPVGWWKMDECQGSTIHDSSGNNNGTLTVGASGTQTVAGTCTTSGTAWGNGVTGKINSSLNFDGTNDYVNFGNVFNESGLKYNLTTSAWFKADSLSSNMWIFSKQQYSVDNQMFGIRTLGNSVVFTVFDDSNNEYQVATAITLDGQWHHVTGTWNNGAQKLYLDGVLKDTQSRSFSKLNDSSGSVYIGAVDSATSGYFSGKIDDVRLYNYALTAQQVKDIYNGGAVSFK